MQRLQGDGAGMTLKTFCVLAAAGTILAVVPACGPAGCTSCRPPSSPTPAPALVHRVALQPDPAPNPSPAP